jgi:hypothetical protein
MSTPTKDDDEELAMLLEIDLDQESEQEKDTSFPSPSLDQFRVRMAELNSFQQSLPPWPDGWIEP